jgi:hypothetical protein
VHVAYLSAARKSAARADAAYQDVDLATGLIPELRARGLAMQKVKAQ